MVIDDTAMIAADTSRTIVYLQALLGAGIIPHHFIVLCGDTAGGPLPGQVGDASLSLRDLLGEIQEHWPASADYLDTADINSNLAIEAISNRPEPVMVYSGFGGAILRRRVLATGKEFLHVHGGFLPTYRGSTTNYYSLIAENSCGASAILLAKEIDGGPLLHRKLFPPPEDRVSIDHGYDAAIRAEVLVETLRMRLKDGGWTEQHIDREQGRTYYIIHPVLKHLAILATR